MGTQQEPQIFRALGQNLLWPSVHAAVDVYQRRRASAPPADHYELIWRIIHICESTVITLASASIARLRSLGRDEEFLRLRERCYGVTWNSAEASLEKGQGALDGSIDKWIEILQFVSGLDVGGSGFLTALKGFLVGPPNSGEDNCRIDLTPFARAWGRACDVPANVAQENATAKDTFQVINSFRNRIAHVPFPYDQLQEIFAALEECVFRLFELPPPAANTASPLTGSFAQKGSLLRGSGYRDTPASWQDTESVSFVWNIKENEEIWDARPFVFIDKMMRPYLLTRLKNDVGSWEYTRYLAEANAVYGVNDPSLLKLLPRPEEAEYPEAQKDGAHIGEAAPVQGAGEPVAVSEPQLGREEALAAVRRRDFRPAIEFWTQVVNTRHNYHSGWLRLGFAQRELGVDLMDTDREEAERLLRESVSSFDHATAHSDPPFSAEAFYNRSKSHWRLWRLTEDKKEFDLAAKDAASAAGRFYDNKFLSWSEFLGENTP